MSAPAPGRNALVWSLSTCMAIGLNALAGLALVSLVSVRPPEAGTPRSGGGGTTFTVRTLAVETVPAGTPRTEATVAVPAAAPGLPLRPTIAPPSRRPEVNRPETIRPETTRPETSGPEVSRFRPSSPRPASPRPASPGAPSTGTTNAEARSPVIRSTGSLAPVLAPDRPVSTVPPRPPIVPLAQGSQSLATRQGTPSPAPDRLVTAAPPRAPAAPPASPPEPGVTGPLAPSPAPDRLVTAAPPRAPAALPASSPEAGATETLAPSPAPDRLAAAALPRAPAALPASLPEPGATGTLAPSPAPDRVVTAAPPRAPEAAPAPASAEAPAPVEIGPAGPSGAAALRAGQPAAPAEDEGPEPLAALQAHVLRLAPQPCLAALPVVDTDGALRVEIFGADETALAGVQADLADLVGTGSDAPRLEPLTVNPAQCAAIDLVRGSADYPGFGLYFTLSNRRIDSGAELDGEIFNIGSRAFHLLLIDNSGRIQSLDPFMRFGRGRGRFGVPLTLQGETIDTWQLLLGLAVPAPLQALRDVQGAQPATPVLIALAEELHARGFVPDLALIAFSVR